MQYRGIGIILAVLLLMVSGCQPRPEAPGKNWVDLDEISGNVERPVSASTVLEKDAAQVAKPEEPGKKDVTPPATGNKNSKLSPFSPKPREVPEELAGEGVLLNFDNADIYEVIQSIAEILDMNYIIDPNVKGTVNIRSGKKIPMEQLFAVFQKMLHINGLDIRSEGVYDYIFVARQQGSDMIRGPERVGELEESPRMVMQIIPVAHLSSAEAMKLVEPYLSEHGKIYDLPSQNYLILTDFESKVLDCVSILSHLDISPLSSLNVSLIRIGNAPLFDLKEELDEIMKAMNVDKKDFQGVSVTPLERINSLLLVSSNKYLLTTVEDWVRDLDVQPSEGGDNIYIYNVRNSVASELGELVNSLIAEKGQTAKTSKKKASKATPPMPGAKTEDKTSEAKPEPSPKPESKTSSAVEPSSAMQFSGEPMLIADDNRNIILIRALQPDYLRLQKLLERLDNMPRQVLIEVLVAEVNLTEGLDLGVEWAFKNRGAGAGSTAHQNIFTEFKGVASSVGDGSSNFVYSIFNQAEDVYGVLNAIGSNNEFTVLSSPQLLVLNNETASINVGDEVPIVTTETVRDNTTTDSVDRTVQYRDTGTILSITPRINNDGIIILEVEQEISKIKDFLEKGVDSPVISKRKVQTKLAVKNGQTIMIGGLISNDVTNAETGVPFLKEIPGIGWLFKFHSEKIDKKELLIMITPYVVETEDVLDQYSREFQKKMKELKISLNPSELGNPFLPRKQGWKNDDQEP